MHARCASSKETTLLGAAGEVISHRLYGRFLTHDVENRSPL